LIGPDFWYLS